MSSSHQTVAATSLSSSSRSTTTLGVAREGARVDIGETSHHVEVPEVLGQGVDLALPGEDLERRQAQVVDRGDLAEWLVETTQDGLAAPAGNDREVDDEGHRRIGQFRPLLAASA